MKKLILIYVFCHAVFFAGSQTIVYIDPTYTGSEDGSYAHPYNSWSDFNFISGITYLQKCGTTYNSAAGGFGAIHIDDKIDIIISSYGIGNKPIIQKTGNNAPNISITRSHNIIIDGFEIIGYNRSNTGIDVSGHWSEGSEGSINIVIRNCDIHENYNGIRSMVFYPKPKSVERLEIYNCNIWNIDEDGIFIASCDNVIILGCRIWNVNMSWFRGTVSPGDGIQLTGECANWLIKDNIIDRKTTACKFSVIVSSESKLPKNSGSFIGNIIYAPKDTFPRFSGDQVGGAGLYVEGLPYVEIAYNKFIGKGYQKWILDSINNGKGQPAIFLKDNDTIDYYYNLFDSTSTKSIIYSSKALHFYNNTLLSNQNGDCILVISKIQSGEFRNNIYAGNTIYDPIKFENVNSNQFIKSNNLTTRGSGTTWNNYFGINDWKTSDFKLTKLSIALDSGYDYDKYFYDLDSVVVPQNDHRDIGAYEFD